MIYMMFVFWYQGDLKDKAKLDEDKEEGMHTITKWFYTESVLVTLMGAWLAVALSARLSPRWPRIDTRPGPYV